MVRTLFLPYFFVPILLLSERLQEIDGIFFAAIVTLRYKLYDLLSGDLGEGGLEVWLFRACGIHEFVGVLAEIVP